MHDFLSGSFHAGPAPVSSGVNMHMHLCDGTVRGRTSPVESSWSLENRALHRAANRRAGHGILLDFGPPHKECVFLVGTPLIIHQHSPSGRQAYSLAQQPSSSQALSSSFASCFQHSRSSLPHDIHQQASLVLFCLSAPPKTPLTDRGLHVNAARFSTPKNPNQS
ncbi:unnamed protein product [Mortierella alpina]